MVIGRRGIDTDEGRCNYTAVKTWFDPKIDRSTKEVGDLVSRVSLDCKGDGCKWRESEDLYLEKGTLVIGRRKVYAKNCAE